MAIRADDDGFLLGERRLQELGKDIKETKDYAKDILHVLMRGVKTAIEAEGEKTRETITRSAIDAANVGNSSRINNAANDAEESQNNSRSSSNPPQSSQSERRSPHRPARNADERSSNSAASRAADARERERGADGRFVGNGENSNSLFKKLKGILENLKPDGIDTSGIDPTLDALHELKQTLSPVTNVFSKMSGRAVSLFAGRIKKRRNEEVLPEEQARANRREEQSDRERNRLLKRMLDALQRRMSGSDNSFDGSFDLSLDGGGEGDGQGQGQGQGNQNERNRRNRRRRNRRRRRNGRGGIRAGLIGGLGKLAKGLPFVGGAIAAALSLSDWNEQSFTEKGGTIGSLAGGAAGGAIGAFGGPIGIAVGTAVGSWAGEKLGGIVAPAIEPYFDKWTESLIKADLPTMLKSSWDGLTELVGKAIGLTPGGLIVSAASTIGSWGKGLWDKMTGERKGNLLFQQQYGGLAPNGSGTVPYNGNGSSVAMKPSKARSQAMQYFMSEKGGGWTKEQAAGIVSNLEAESKFKTNSIGDKGQAYGIAQWHPDRQRMFAKRFGKDIRQASFEEQLEFVNYELQTNEKAAGDKLRNAKTPEEAGAIVSRHYERPDKKDIEASVRAQSARNIFNLPNQDGLDGKNKESNNSSSESVKIPYVNKKPSETSAVKVVGAEKRPTIKVPQITPDISKIGSSQKQVVVAPQQSDSFISQDVSNRGLAHTFSGGLGYNRIVG